MSAKWKDGVTEANRGDKAGKVRLARHQCPPPTARSLYLYETEGRNLTLMDSTNVQNQAFDFGQVDAHRGFYQLATDNAKNNCQFVMNPDEPQVNLKFRSKQLTSSKTAEGSQENAAWFTYQNFSRVNNNQIRSLRKQLKDSPFRAQVEKQIEDKEMELVAKQHELMGQYPDTYLAKFLGWRNPKYPKSQGQLFRRHGSHGQQLGAQHGHQRPHPRVSWWRTARAKTPASWPASTW